MRIRMICIVFRCFYESNIAEFWKWKRFKNFQKFLLFFWIFWNIWISNKAAVLITSKNNFRLFVYNYQVDWHLFRLRIMMIINHFNRRFFAWKSNQCIIVWTRIASYFWFHFHCIRRVQNWHVFKKLPEMSFINWKSRIV